MLTFLFCTKLYRAKYKLTDTFDIVSVTTIFFFALSNAMYS